MDPVEEMLKTLEQMRLTNREAQLSLKRLETVTLEDSRRGQRQWSIATAAAQMPKQQAQPYPVKPAGAGPAPIPLAPARPTLNPLALAPTGPQTYGLKDPNAVPLAPQTPAGPTPAANPYALQQVPQKIADSCDCFKDALAPLVTLVEKIFAGIKVLVGQAGMGKGGGVGDGLQHGKDYDRTLSSKDVINPTSLKGQIDGAVKSVTGSLGMMAPVVTAATQAFTSLTGQIGKFVEAVNPAVMAQFQFVMRDLSATIGIAMTPLMQTASALAREFGSVLLPIMRQLQPIFAQMGQTLLQASQPYMKFISELLTASLPIVKLFADLQQAFLPVVQIVYGILTSALKALAAILQPVIGLIGLLARAIQPLLQMFQLMSKANGSLIEVLGNWLGKMISLAATVSPLVWILRGLGAAGELLKPVVEAIGTVMAGVTETMTVFIDSIATWLSGLFGFDLTDVFNNLKGLFEKLATGIVLVTAHIAKALGFTSFIDGMKKALGGPKKEDNTGIGAARDAQIGGLDSLRQSVMKASLLAGPAGMKSEEQQWREKTLAELEKMNTGEDVVSKIRQMIGDNIKVWARDAREAIVGQAGAAFDEAKAATKDVAKKGAGVVDRAAGGVFSAIGRLAGF